VAAVITAVDDAQTPLHSVSVAGAVIRSDGRVLVVQRRDNGNWEPPGGVLELDETFEACVRREVAEETGVDVAVERLTGGYKNMSRCVVALLFRCRPIGGVPTETEEAQHVRWLSPDEVQQHMSPAYAVRISDALRDGVATRAHDGVHLIER
jgi:8-oxo-dGTP pyrophosphatase MutT (NUDIX family)